MSRSCFSGFQGLEAPLNPSSPLNFSGFQGLEALLKPSRPLNFSGIQGLESLFKPWSPLNFSGFQGLEALFKPSGVCRAVRGPSLKLKNHPKAQSRAETFHHLRLDLQHFQGSSGSQAGQAGDQVAFERMVRNELLDLMELRLNALKDIRKKDLEAGADII